MKNLLNIILMLKAVSAGRLPMDKPFFLDRSVRIKETSTRRVGVDGANQEIVVFDETHPGKGIYHGHIRAFEQLTPEMKSVLQQVGLIDRRGKIIESL